MDPGKQLDEKVPSKQLDEVELTEAEREDLRQVQEIIYIYIYMTVLANQKTLCWLDNNSGKDNKIGDGGKDQKTVALTRAADQGLLSVPGMQIKLVGEPDLKEVEGRRRGTCRAMVASASKGIGGANRSGKSLTVPKRQ
jgi:hypothetical protein